MKFTKFENRWALYDWANSVYSLTITTAIFPPFYEAIAKSKGVGEQHIITMLGISLPSSVWYSYSISFLALCVAILTPLLSGVADASGRKRAFMRIFYTLGAAACIGLFWFSADRFELGMGMFILAGIGFSGSLVFYDAFLPEVTTPERYDRVSARGFAYGYVGSVLLLILNLAVILMVDKIFPIAAKAAELQAELDLSLEAATKEASGYFTSLATRISFVCVGVWWLVFATISTRAFPKEIRLGGFLPISSIALWAKGFRELRAVVGGLKHHPALQRYLGAYFFLAMGVQTVFGLASLFGKEELDMDLPLLIGTVLIIQIVAIFGANIFARLSTRRGNVPALIIAIVLWIVVCIAAFFIQTSGQFMILAGLVGLVMGAIQSMQRSTFAKLIPEDSNDHATYFSLYDVTERVAIVIGTATFGFIDNLTGSMRYSALTLTIFFLIGLFILMPLRSNPKLQAIEPGS